MADEKIEDFGLLSTIKRSADWRSAFSAARVLPPAVVRCLLACALRLTPQLCASIVDPGCTVPALNRCVTNAASFHLLSLKQMAFSCLIVQD